MQELLIGVVSGVIASIIVLTVTSIHEYILRKETEKCKIYELEYIGKRDACAPPEYARESTYVEPLQEEGLAEDYYENVDIVKLQFPFDIKDIKVFEYEKKVYPTDDIENLPAGNPIYINCRLDLGVNTPAFIVKCKTFRHEYREYEYTTIYKYSGGIAGFGLKMTKQSFTL